MAALGGQFLAGRTAQQAGVPAETRRGRPACATAALGGQLVPGVLDSSPEHVLVWLRVRGDRHFPGFQVHLYSAYAGDLADLRADGVDAMTAGHTGYGYDFLAHAG